VTQTATSLVLCSSFRDFTFSYGGSAREWSAATRLPIHAAATLAATLTTYTLMVDLRHRLSETNRRLGSVLATNTISELMIFRPSWECYMLSSPIDG
jgi:hypothetical protein